MNKQITGKLLGIFLGFISAVPALAADAGSVTFATGAVTAERAPAATLTKGDTVLTEDNVITGEGARAQLLMIDGAKIALRPNSRVVINDYVYAAAAPAAATITTSADDSSVISLVKGGFRTITGAISKEDPSNYEVRTAVGTLGVRGTNFAVLLCGGDCDSDSEEAGGAPIPDGLYLSVAEGAIVFSNEIATIELTAGEFAFIPLDTRQPARLESTPAVFIDDRDLRFEADAAVAPTGFDENLGTRRAPDPGAPGSGTADPAGTNQDDGSGRDVPAQSIQGIDSDGSTIDLTPGGTPDPQSRTIGYSTGPLGPVTVAQSTVLDNSPGQAQLDDNNDVTGFVNNYQLRTNPDVATFDIGTSSNVESGFDSMTVLRWGRWSGGTANITLSDGTDVSQDLGTQSIHWISSPEWATPPVMPITGVADYTLVGATSPTDNLGNTGTLGAATFSADFTNMRVDSSLVIDINGAIWAANGQGIIGGQALLPAHLFQGNYAVTIGASGSGTGIFSGFFSQPGATSDPSFPGGAGLSYSLREPGGATVSGAAAFGNP
jgi:hypothetical protein